jgi:hypothetical protein
VGGGNFLKVTEGNSAQTTSAVASQKRRIANWPVAIVFVALIVAVLCAFIYLRIESWPMRTAHQSLDEVERVVLGVQNTFLRLGNLQPRITVNNRVYIQQSQSVAELTILMRDIEVEHEMQQTWAGSTKRVKLHALFTARAGFDLLNDVNISSNADEVVVSLPHAQLLGVEQKQVEVLEFEHGYWNRISAADMEQELAMLPSLAQQKARDAAMPEAAEREIEQQLKSRIKIGKTLRITFGPVGAHE